MGPQGAPGVIWRSPQPSKNEPKTHQKMTPTCPLAVPEQKWHLQGTAFRRDGAASSDATVNQGYIFDGRRETMPNGRSWTTRRQVPNYDKMRRSGILKDEAPGDNASSALWAPASRCVVLKSKMAAAGAALVFVGRVGAALLWRDHIATVEGCAVKQGVLRRLTGRPALAPRCDRDGM